MSDTKESTSAPGEARNLGWRVTLAGTGINLALGVLYTWSVISKRITADWGWSETAAALPYSVAILVFALMMVPAGWLQDRLGPRLVATLGGIFCGGGFIVASLGQSPILMVVGFGILAGSGIGLAYASATPAAVKWFPAQRTGLIAGLVVAGFGLASVYAAPLANYLLGAYGIQKSFLVFGIAFLVLVVVLSQALRNPPAGFKPQAAAHPSAAAAAAPRAPASEYNAVQMMSTPQFYLLWIMFCFGAGAGLMIIGKLAKIVDFQAGIQAGFVFVALLAIGNASGRVLAGVVSDKIGRTWTMFICFMLQAVLLLALKAGNGFAPLAAASMLIGANYGANLTLFPSVTKDYFGMKNFGLNYGLVFTAWGVGGLLGPMLSGRIFDATHSFDGAYMIAAVCLLVAAALTFVTRAPRPSALGSAAQQHRAGPASCVARQRASEEHRPSRERRDRSASSRR